MPEANVSNAGLKVAGASDVCSSPENGPVHVVDLPKEHAEEDAREEDLQRKQRRHKSRVSQARTSIIALKNDIKDKSQKLLKQLSLRTSLMLRHRERRESFSTDENSEDDPYNTNKDGRSSLDAPSQKQDDDRWGDHRRSLGSTSCSGQSTGGRLSNGPFAADERSMREIGPPADDADWVWDDASGYYHNPVSGMYYDGRSGLMGYYRDGQWVHYQPRKSDHRRITASTRINARNSKVQLKKSILQEHAISPVLWFAVVDTSCFFCEEEFAALQYFKKMQGSVILVIPLAVVRELDTLKREEGKKGHDARAGVRFIAEALQSGAMWLRAQQHHEHPANHWRRDSVSCGRPCGR
mmetsp:Transcript_34350/g.75137  ORF Transcript_34350/g.75137 Transcript_34350/m.75137 type:complete len:353 (+) Transcript_34350:432-1490(+)